MFSRKCDCKVDTFKIVRPLLDALSVNGLSILSKVDELFMCWCISNYGERVVSVRGLIFKLLD